MAFAANIRAYSASQIPAYGDELVSAKLLRVECMASLSEQLPV